MQGIIVLIVYALLMVGATKAFTKREDGGESFHESRQRVKNTLVYFFLC